MYTSIGNRFETCTSIGVGKLSVSVVTTTNPDDSLTMAQQGSNETLHNTSWNVLQRRETLWKCQVVGSSGAHADPVHPVYVFLGLNPANGQAVVMCGRCARNSCLTRATCVVWPCHAETFRR